MKQKLLIVVMTLLVCRIAIAGNVLITEVHYDPNGSEYDLEFVELFNPNSEPVLIGGFWINTSSSERDATLPSGATIPAKGHFLIADTGFGGANPASWPGADYEEDMTLVNSGGYVALVSSSGIENKVEWGDDGSEGQSLSRAYSNGAYGSTFVYAAPSPQASAAGMLAKDILIELVVNRTAPKITGIYVDDEAPEKPGIQVFPIPGTIKQKGVRVATEGNVNSINISFNGKGLGNVSSFKIPYSLEKGNYTLSAVACEASLCAGMSITIAIEEVLGFELDTSELEVGAGNGGVYYVEGDLDFSTVGKPTVRNSGNTPVKLELSTSGLSLGNSSIPPGYISVQMDTAKPFFELSSPYRADLSVLGKSMLSLQFELPSAVVSGTYNGSIMIRGGK